MPKVMAIFKDFMEFVITVAATVITIVIINLNFN